MSAVVVAGAAANSGAGVDGADERRQPPAPGDGGAGCCFRCSDDRAYGVRPAEFESGGVDGASCSAAGVGYDGGAAVAGGGGGGVDGEAVNEVQSVVATDWD